MAAVTLNDIKRSFSASFLYTESKCYSALKSRIPSNDPTPGGANDIYWNQNQGDQDLILNTWHPSTGTYQAGPYTYDEIIARFPGIDASSLSAMGLVNRPHYRMTTGASTLFGSAGSSGPSGLPVPTLAGPGWDPLRTDATQFDISRVLAMGFLPGRRPGKDGYIVQQPERVATIRVMTHDGLPVFASTNFMLVGVQHGRQEAMSQNQSFDGPLVQFGVEKGCINTFAVQLFDARNFDWLRSWKSAWETYLRGSVMTRNRWRFYIMFGGHIVGGYLEGYQGAMTAEAEPASQITFSCFVTDDYALPDLILYDQGYYFYNGTMDQLSRDIGALNLLQSPAEVPGKVPVALGNGEYVNPNVIPF